MKALVEQKAELERKVEELEKKLDLEIRVQYSVYVIKLLIISNTLFKLSDN